MKIYNRCEKVLTPKDSLCVETSPDLAIEVTIRDQFNDDIWCFTTCKGITHGSHVPFHEFVAAIDELIRKNRERKSKNCGNVF